MKKLGIIISVLLLIATATVFVIGLTADLPSGMRLLNFTPEEHALTFDADDSFRILHVSDFHEWMGIELEGVMNIEFQDILKPLLTSYLTSVLDKYAPDLVVVGGDNIFSLSLLTDFSENGISMRTYRAIADFFEEREQYWTCTFGNHDSESAHPKEDFLKVLIGYDYFIGGFSDGENCNAAVFEAPPEVDAAADDFVGNYSIPIYGKDGSIRYNVYVLDSGSHRATGYPYLSITDEQTDWYLEESLRLESLAGAPVPSLIFTHIPFIEMQEAYEASGSVAGSYTGISPSDTRSEIFEACFGRGDVTGIFFGHNHYNSASVIYERDGREILLSVTPACQAQSYEDTETPMHARVIDLKTDGSFITYVVGSSLDAVTEEVAFPCA